MGNPGSATETDVFIRALVHETVQTMTCGMTTPCYYLKIEENNHDTALESETAYYFFAQRHEDLPFQQPGYLIS